MLSATVYWMECTVCGPDVDTPPPRFDDPATLLYRAVREPGDAVEVVLELAVSPVHVFVGRHTLEQRPELLQRLNHGLQRARQQPEWAQVLGRYPGV